MYDVALYLPCFQLGSLTTAFAAGADIRETAIAAAPAIDSAARRSRCARVDVFSSLSVMGWTLGAAKRVGHVTENADLRRVSVESKLIQAQFGQRYPVENRREGKQPSGRL